MNNQDEKRSFDKKYEFTMSNNATPQEVADGVKKYGIVVINNYVEGEVLEDLRKDFEDVYKNIGVDDSDTTGYDKMEGVNNVRLSRKKIANDKYDAIINTFTSDYMDKVARLYLDTEDYDLNANIFVCHHLETKEPRHVLPFLTHYDKAHTLKFFLYLEELDRNNGVMEVTAGTHNKNKAVRESEMEIKDKIAEVENVVSENEDDLIPVEGRAGTILIFDTDISHRAGHVRPGFERKIIRGHTVTGTIFKEIESKHNLGFFKKVASKFGFKDA